MARILSTFPEDTLRGGRYPWPSWFDGQAWELKQGEDFEVTPRAFRSAAQQAQKAANKRGKTGVVRTVINSEKTVVVQWMTTAEVAAEADEPAGE